MKRSRVRSIAMVVGTVHLVACVSWTRVPDPGSMIDQLRTRPQAARVYLADSSVISYRVPVIRGDSILEGDRQYGTGRPIAIAHVARIDIQQVEAGRVALIGIGGFLAAIVFLVASTNLIGFN